MARQRGDGFVADGIDKQGRRQRVQFRTLARAQDYKEQILSHQSKHTVGHLFPKWADELWVGTKNEYDARGRTKLVIQALGKDTPVRSIDRVTIKKLSSDWLAQGNTRATINRKLSVLSRLLKHAVDEEVIDDFPHIKLTRDKNSRRFRVFTYDEEDRLLAAFEDEAERRFVEFLIDTGCRFGETAAGRLRWTDVNGRSLSIWASKTGAARTIPLTDRACEALAWTRTQGWLTPWDHIVYRTFMEKWHRARVKAGLGDDVIPYVCRHTCATRLAVGGMGLFQLMQWMGHSNPSTTRLYIQLNTENLQSGVAILSRPRLRAV